MSGFQVFNAQPDWEIMRNNWELASEVERRRGEIGRRSGWHFTDAEWDVVLPGLVTSIVEHFPPGDNLRLDFSGITVSRGPVKRKTIEIQRRPDGSTATITETP